MARSWVRNTYIETNIWVIVRSNDDVGQGVIVIVHN